VLLPLFALVSLVAGTMPSFSLSANVLVIGIGGALFCFGVTHVPSRHDETGGRFPRSAALWLLPVGLLIVVEAVAFLAGSTPDYPTLSKLADPVLDHYLPRALLYFGWLYGFWGLIQS
jgi:hypothetical protein